MSIIDWNIIAFASACSIFTKFDSVFFLCAKHIHLYLIGFLPYVSYALRSKCSDFKLCSLRILLKTIELVQQFSHQYTPDREKSNYVNRNARGFIKGFLIKNLGRDDTNQRVKYIGGIVVKKRSRLSTMIAINAMWVIISTALITNTAQRIFGFMT